MNWLSRTAASIPGRFVPFLANSQLRKLFGVEVDKGDQHYQTIHNVALCEAL